MKLVNGAEPPKKPDGTYETVCEDTFNMCTECGDQLDPYRANDAFGTEWATCEDCLSIVFCEDCGDELEHGGVCNFCEEEGSYEH